jgi:ribonuclease D
LLEDTPLWLVNDPEMLARCAERLGKAPAIGVDTESDSFHHYQEKVCLLQFSDLETDYIVDPLALNNDLGPLAAVLADPKVIKIFHGADYDVVCMKRDYGFTIANIFDTMVSAQQLALGGVGLADLIGRFFGVDVDKKYQRHDWAERPLRPEHIEYARGDTHYLISLREILVRKLAKVGRLKRVEEECRRLEKREWEGRKPDEHAWMRMKTGGVQLDDAGKRILRRLWMYRDEQAKRMDRPPFKTIPDPVLVDVAAARPRNDAELERLFPYAKTAMKRRHGPGFLDAVAKGLEDDFEIPKNVGRKKGRESSGPPPRLSARAADKALEALKTWRNEIIGAGSDITAVAVISNGTLKAIARMRPMNKEELAAIEDVREWQVESYGDAILAVLDAAVPVSEIGKEPADDDPDQPKRRRGRRRGRR